MEEIEFRPAAPAGAARPAVVLFYGGPLSNWHPARFRDGASGVVYLSGQHYLMHQKALYFRDAASAEYVMQHGADPLACAIRGKRLAGYSEVRWANRRYRVALRGLLMKFRQDRDLARELVATLPLPIAEAGPHLAWGIGLAADDPAAMDPQRWLGQNLMGKALMDVRDTLANAKSRRWGL